MIDQLIYILGSIVFYGFLAAVSFLFIWFLWFWLSIAMSFAWICVKCEFQYPGLALKSETTKKWFFRSRLFAYYLKPKRVFKLKGSQINCEYFGADYRGVFPKVWINHDVCKEAVE